MSFSKAEGQTALLLAIGKLRPLIAQFPEHHETTYRIGFNLRDGHQLDAHDDIKRLLGCFHTLLRQMREQKRAEEAGAQPLQEISTIGG